jgi:hypothetical protein
VQKSELDVLRGIDEIDWPKIEQIVMEVHDIEDRLSHIVSLLRGHGYHVLAEQDELYQGSVLYNLYATRQQPTGYSVGGYLTQQPWERISPQQIHRRAINQREAQMRQRQLLGKRGNEE